MTIKIDRLKLRLPAGLARDPNAFSRAVVRGLAQESIGAPKTQVQNLRLRLPQPNGNAPAAVAQAIGRAMNKKGNS